jgi:hypothetical protein
LGPSLKNKIELLRRIFLFIKLHLLPSWGLGKGRGGFKKNRNSFKIKFNFKRAHKQHWPVLSYQPMNLKPNLLSTSEMKQK